MEPGTSGPGFMDLINKCNRMEIPDVAPSQCMPFIIEGSQVGLIPKSFWKHLETYSDVFYLESTEKYGDCIRLHHFPSVEERSRKVEGVLKDLRGKKIFKKLQGWRDEEYAVRTSYTSPTLMNIERAGINIFGIPSYGTHMNGYTYSADGKLMMWIGRRSATKPTWPGKLDNLSAGGLPVNMSVLECMKKECQEEASIDESLLEKLIPAGSVSYMYGTQDGLYPETQFVYDLELPPDFAPKNADGEMSNFYLLTIDEIKKKILEEDFKPNCGLVILDFLIRMGIITPDTEPRYLEIVELLHRPIQYLFRDFTFWSNSDIPRFQ
ncbi:nudix hydrolase 20, chloroplastic-like isoform X1 [Octopus vulgaris]|uniref:Nudix hydrolase 20, chloroplastic-like isoform X1 n=1 Tax=Octopus vulgaris TaxID=6645 RepID=A0AA36C2J2_OCTVU|nr:nudix hydrolase 20, chloroplastic-like isoform X1 [Octopus vulgaris]